MLNKRRRTWIAHIEDGHAAPLAAHRNIGNASVQRYIERSISKARIAEDENPNRSRIAKISNVYDMHALIGGQKGMPV